MHIYRIQQNRDKGVANFESLLRDSNPFDQNFGTNEDPKIAGSLARNVRGLSSPAPMRNQVTRPRKATVPDNKASNTHPHENEVPLVPIYHGQNFIWFSKYRRIRLFKFRDYPCGVKEATKILFRVYTVTKLDLPVLRKTAIHYVSLGIRSTAYNAVEAAYPLLPWMESRRIDVWAKFIIIGVPDRVSVTSASKFYLQSLYDRRKR
ncbi:hypothetical protein PsorP6_011786 [Peronosclerospora sorghi]|uniref:Uncharacterized protein n=1 Tax=Peronosclerospora sorghi TaxID=230839 RepID=A0ACC0WL12_9STRA|nr:hypothetical protein PsorP6_011786 [Peronosclerospora sorghi]